MSNQDKPTTRIAIFLPPGEGRPYPMGRISAVFKADRDETQRQYAISEWWLEPHTQGPGAHSHPVDDIFYVIEGTMSFLIGDRWIDAAKGSFVLAPGGMTHDFQNRSANRAGVLNFSVPGISRRACQQSPNGLPRTLRKTPAKHSRGDKYV